MRAPNGLDPIEPLELRSSGKRPPLTQCKSEMSIDLEGSPRLLGAPEETLSLPAFVAFKKGESALAPCKNTDYRPSRIGHIDLGATALKTSEVMAPLAHSLPTRC
jgi:hypothetical protein